MERTMSDTSVILDKFTALLGKAVVDKLKEERSQMRCPITGAACEGDLSHLCQEYGCARKGGLSPRSNENF
jgi:hypothetical protein